MAPQDGGWSAYRDTLEGHRIAGRIVFASAAAPGVPLTTALTRAKDWSIVADVSAALFVMRRLLSTAEALHAATGSQSFALSHERMIVTPRGAILLVEPDADTFDMKPDGADGSRLDIAEIAIVGVSLMAGRAVDAIEASDPQSPLLKEMRDAIAIRADMTFAGALHEWLDRALSADPRSGFADFQSACAALDELPAPKGCRPSRRLFRSFLADLQLPDFSNPKLAVAEIEHVGDLRRAIVAQRPATAPPGDTQHAEDDSWAAIDFSDASEPETPAAPAPVPAASEPPSAFESFDADDSSVDYEPYRAAEIPATFHVPEPEPEPEPEESSIFVKPSEFVAAHDPEPTPEPEPQESSAFVAPTSFEAAPEPAPEAAESSVFTESQLYRPEIEPTEEPEPEPEPKAEPEPEHDSVWGRQTYSEPPEQPKPAPAEDPNSWIPNEARPPEERQADEPMTMSWLPGEARQAIMPNAADVAGWMIDAKPSAAAEPTPIEAEPPPPPVAEARPAPAPPVEDDKDWFKPVAQESAPPPDDKDWFKPPVPQAPPSADQDRDWFKAQDPEPVAEEEPDEELEEHEAIAKQSEEWFPARTEQLQEDVPPADLPPPPVVVPPPPESSGWDKRVAPLREEADLSAHEHELDAGPSTLVHGAGASIIERPFEPPPPEEPAPKPRRERRPIHIETPSAGSAIRTIVVTATLAGAAVAGGYYYTHMSTPGTVTFETKPMGLELLQDGTVKGKTPMTLTLKPGTYEFSLRRGKTTKPLHIEVAEASHITQKVDFTSLKPVGTLTIATDPPGAKITLDGKSRGTTPQTLNDVPIGQHTVVLEGEQGTLRRQVNVEEQETTTINEGIFPGFLKVDATFDVKVLEGGRAIGGSDGQISMKAGRHEVELVNESQGYREIRTVDITPGEIKRILAK